MEVDFHILKRADRRPGALLLPPSVQARYGYKRRDFLLGEDRPSIAIVDDILSDKAMLSMLNSTEVTNTLEIGKVTEWLKQSVDDITLTAFLEKSRDWSPQMRAGVNGMIKSEQYKVDVGQIVVSGMATLLTIVKVSSQLAAIPDPTLTNKIVAGAVIVAAVLAFVIYDWHELSKIFKDPPRFANWIEAWGGQMQLLHENCLNNFVTLSLAPGASNYPDRLLGTSKWNGEKIARMFYKMKTLREGHSLFPNREDFGDNFHLIPYEDHFRALMREVSYTIPKIATSKWESIYSALSSSGDEYTIAMITSMLLARGQYIDMGVKKSLTDLRGQWPEDNLFPEQTFRDRGDGNNWMLLPTLTSPDYRHIYAASSTLHQEEYARADAFGFPAALRFYYLNESVQMQMPYWGEGSTTPSVKRARARRPQIHYIADMPGRQKFQGVIIGLIRAHAYQLLGEITEGIPAKLDAMAAAIEGAGAKTFKTELIYPHEVIQNINRDAIAVATATADPKGLQAVMDGVKRQPILQSIFGDRFIAPPTDNKSSGAGLAIGAAALYALSQG